MPDNVYKSYDKIKNKLRVNFEDTKYLIALFFQILDRISILSKKVDRLWASVSVLSTRINEKEQEI